MQLGTHQDVLELDVSVQEALAVQEADPLHHVQGDLQPLSERQTSLRRAEAASRKLSGGGSLYWSNLLHSRKSSFAV